MNGTEWVYDLVNRISSPLADIYKDLDLTDHAAAKTEKSLSDIGATSGPITVLSNDINELEEHTHGLGDTMLEIAGGFGIWNTAEAIFEGVKEAVVETYQEVKKAGIEMQKFDVLFGAAFGSKEAGLEMQDMLEGVMNKIGVTEDVIKKTFISLKNEGFEPTKNQLIQLGDLATAFDTPFGDMANTVQQASLGMFRGLKQMGVVMEPLPDHAGKLTATFRGQKIVIDDNQEAIRNYVLGLSEMEGIHGTAADMMKTLAGTELILINTTDKLHETMSKVLNGAMVSWNQFRIEGVEKTIHAFEWINEHGKEIKDVMGAIAVAVGIASGAWVIMNAEMLIGQGIAGGALLIVGLLDAAMWGLALAEAVVASPLLIVIGLLSALGGILYYAYNESDTFRAAMDGVWDSMKVLGEGIVEFAIAPFKLWLELLKSAGEILVGVFTGDYDMIKKGMDDALQAFKDANPIDKIKKVGEDTANAYKDGYNKSMAGATLTDWGVEQQPTEGGFNMLDKSQVTAANASAAGSRSSSGDSGSGSGRGGLIIQKIELGNGIHIHAATVREGAAEMRKILHEELMGAVRDFEIGMSNG